MYISEVHIKNYRNFGDPSFVIKLKPFTLLLGENNIGKTNLLSALGLIFSQELTIFRRRVLELDDINYGSVHKFKLAISDFSMLAKAIELPIVRIDIILSDFKDDLDQKTVVGHWPIDTQITRSQITYLYAPRNNFDKTLWIDRQRETLKDNTLSLEQKLRLIDFPINEYRYSIFGGNDPTRECESHLLQMLRMEFLDALRDAQKELIASGDYRLLYRVLSQKDVAQYSNIRVKLQELESEISGNPNLIDVKNDVSKLLDRISLQTTNGDNTIGFNFTAPETNEILKKISMIYGTNPIDVSRNGLGRNNLLYLSLVLSHLTVDKTNNSEIHFRLITIEEPESHLHPHLQDHLAENIEDIRNEAQGKMQLLLTSHSTHIAAKLDLDNTVVIYYDHEQGRLASHYILSGFDQKQDKTTIHYLRKYLDATKSRMFFARKIILVEGISEQLLTAKLFEIYSNGTTSIQKSGYNILNVQGIAFSHFLKVVKSGFFIRCLVLTDSDSTKKTQQRATALKKEFDSPGLILIEISSNSTFEKDIIFSNRSEKGKKILIEALKQTKPQSGREFEALVDQNDVDVEQLFSEIEDYKAEFAFNLLSQLTRDSNGFVIPDYIQRGFAFMIK